MKKHGALVCSQLKLKEFQQSSITNSTERIYWKRKALENEAGLKDAEPSNYEKENH